MIINVTIQSNESSQTIVFNVEISDVLNPADTLLTVLSTVKKLTKYKVTVGHGYRGWGGTPINLIELIAIVSDFKFYKYKNKKVTVEVKTKLASFYDKSFLCEYVPYIGATFFDDIDRRIIKYTRDALSDILPYYYSLYKSKRGNYYCWKHLSIEHTGNVWTLFEISKKEIIEKVQVIEK